MNLNFILPIQSPGATVIDGSAIIIIGALIVAYYAYKYLKNRNNIPVESVVHNENINVSENKVEQKHTDFVRPKTANITQKTINKQKQEVPEEDVIIQEKKVVINQRNN